MTEPAGACGAARGTLGRMVGEVPAAGRFKPRPAPPPARARPPPEAAPKPRPHGVAELEAAITALRRCVAPAQMAAGTSRRCCADRGSGEFVDADLVCEIPALCVRDTRALMAGLREGRALVDAALILRKALLRDGGASPAVRAAVRQMCGLEDDGEDEEDAEVGAEESCAAALVRRLQAEAFRAKKVLAGASSRVAVRHTLGLRPEGSGEPAADGRGTQGGHPAHDFDPVGLAPLLVALREVESDLDYQGELVAEVEARLGGTGAEAYSRDNFAYGSTPYSTWHTVVVDACPGLRARLEAGGVYCVWGSSLGWLVFYAAFTFPSAVCRGVELLETHVAASRRLAESPAAKAALFSGPTKPTIVLDKGDLLASDIANVDVLVLTSQCWDAELKARCRGKILAELRAGAYVVDYGDGVLGCEAEAFEVVATPGGSVSWNSTGQQFYVYARRQAPARRKTAGTGAAALPRRRPPMIK